LWLICGPIGNLKNFSFLNFKEIETGITLEITQIESINNWISSFLNKYNNTIILKLRVAEPVYSYYKSFY